VQGGATAKAQKAAAAVKQGLRSKKSTKVRKNTTFHRPKTLKAARAPKYPRKSAPKTNKLDQFQIIKYAPARLSVPCQAGPLRRS
jgi:large subunit ribosomal protein L23Ae